MLWCRSYPTLPDRIAGNNRVVAKSFRTLPIIPDSGRSYGAQTQLESFAESPTNGKIIHGEVQGLSATVLGVSIQQHWYYLFGNWLYDCWWVHYYHLVTEWWRPAKDWKGVGSIPQGLRIFYSFIWESKVRVHCSREVILKMLLQHNPWGLVFTGGLIFQCLKLKVNFNWKSTLTVILTVLKRCSLIPPIAWDLKVCPQFHTSTLPR